MDLTVFDQDGMEKSTVSVSDAIFSRTYNSDLVHQLIVRHQANLRGGTRAQKNRADVAHSTRKPWKQKGTGRARAGMRSSPLWRGGGRAFPSSPDENFTKKINKKMFRIGMSCIYSQLIRDGRVRIVENICIDAPKTKLFIHFLAKLGLQNTLVCVEDLSSNVFLSSRNVPNVRVVLPREADPVSLVKHHSLLLTKQAILMIEEDLAC